MADWNQPGLDEYYVDYLQKLKDRDYDSISLGVAAITNPVAGMMRYVRASNKFQEYDGTTWVDKVISVAGGGTGSTTPGGIGSAIGLGTLAYQNSNAINVTGGQLTGLAAVQINGGGSANARWDVGGGSYIAGLFEARGGLKLTGGVLQAGTGNVNIIGVDGRIPAISPTYFANMDGSQLTGIVSFVAGMVMPFAGPSPPAGWFICDGAAVSRISFAALFAAIGGYYGIGDGSTTFNLPNLQGRMPIGYGTGSGLTFRNFGEVGGAENVALTTPQLPSHYHPITDKAHFHTVWTGNESGGIEQEAIAYGAAPGALYRDSNNRGTALISYSNTGITATDGQGADQAHNNMQPYIAMYYIIKA